MKLFLLFFGNRLTLSFGRGLLLFMISLADRVGIAAISSGELVGQTNQSQKLDTLTNRSPVKDCILDPKAIALVESAQDITRDIELNSSNKSLVVQQLEALQSEVVKLAPSAIESDGTLNKLQASVFLNVSGRFLQDLLIRKADNGTKIHNSQNIDLPSYRTAAREHFAHLAKTASNLENQLEAEVTRIRPEDGKSLRDDYLLLTAVGLKYDTELMQWNFDQVTPETVLLGQDSERIGTARANLVSTQNHIQAIAEDKRYQKITNDLENNIYEFLAVSRQDRFIFTKENLSKFLRYSGAPNPENKGTAVNVSELLNRNQSKDELRRRYNSIKQNFKDLRALLKSKYFLSDKEDESIRDYEKKALATLFGIAEENNEIGLERKGRLAQTLLFLLIPFPSTKLMSLVAKNAGSAMAKSTIAQSALRIGSNKIQTSATLLRKTVKSNYFPLTALLGLTGAKHLVNNSVTGSPLICDWEESLEMVLSTSQFIFPPTMVRRLISLYAHYLAPINVASRSYLVANKIPDWGYALELWLKSSSETPDNVTGNGPEGENAQEARSLLKRIKDGVYRPFIYFYFLFR